MGRKICVILSVALMLCMSGCTEAEINNIKQAIESYVPVDPTNDTDLTYPVYSGDMINIINNNIPVFSEDELIPEGRLELGEFDRLGRTTAAFAVCSIEMLPTGDRDYAAIKDIYPSGWVQKSYDNLEKYYDYDTNGYYGLYNRSHLIAYSLTGNNDARDIVGLTVLSNEAMWYYESQVLNAVYDGYHVAYKVEPVYEGWNLLCKGIHMQAYSIEDAGTTVSYSIFVHNTLEPEGIHINYATGESWMD